MILIDKYLFHSVSNSEYIGIITILDYEILLKQCLSKLVLPSLTRQKVLVDLALKTGLNKYRFVTFDVDNNGKIILNTNSYVNVSNDIEKAANSFCNREKILSIIHFYRVHRKRNFFKKHTIV